MVTTPLPTSFNPGRSASWLSQLGVTSAIEAQANMGAGVTIGIVDSGVTSTQAEVTGRVLTTSSCAAVTFTCSSGYKDDYGHGTATAAIAAGKYSASAPMSGVAPAANIVAEKVLSSSGTGYDSDVANGIKRAADAGATVINLSLSYTPTAAVISAINYATAKNAVIVWAAGNNSTSLNNGASTTGLTAASISRIIFVGSVGASNVHSSFSNSPGNGSAYAGTTRQTYASMFINANGENIYAPEVAWGANSYAYWTGTSMAAPEVAGAVALLQATWPVLTRNGTAAAVLFSTAKDLGVAGVDSTYGTGLLDLTKAFQPIGALSVTTASGSSVPVSSLSSAMVTSGALGSLPSVQSQLSKYTTFDTFQRNFTSNLSGLVSSASASTVASANPVASTTTTTAGAHFAGGGYAVATVTRALSFGEQVFGDDGANGVSDRLFGVRDRRATAMMLVGGNGTVIAMSRGMGSTSAFAQAYWGADSAEAGQIDGLGASTALLGLAQGGNASSMGGQLGSRVRLAAAWSRTDETTGSGLSSNRTRSDASAAVVALNGKVTNRWTLGVSYSSLKETNGLLGATYDGAGLLSLGGRHSSTATAVTSAYNLGHGRGVVADATWVNVSGSTGGGADALIRDVSPLKARAYGVAIFQADAFMPGDRLSIAVRKPLRVVSGTANLAVTSVDSQGYASTVMTPVSLAPNGNETDLEVGYGGQLRRNLSFSGAVDLRHDAQNVRGQGDVAFKAAMRLAF
ncbi:MAG: S8 family serine peptidase [Proteobacteria bacterium]|nr:S8 family serine peptidase [Pseudomonadota bacterium]